MWEQRGSKQFYYKKVRRGQAVVSEYWGRDEAAHLIAERIQFLKEDAFFSRDVRKIHREHESAEHQLIQAVERVITVLTRSTLQNLGYHVRKGE